MSQHAEHLTVATLADKFGQPVDIMADLFCDTLDGLSNSKTVQQHLKTKAAKLIFQRTIQRLNFEIEADDDITLGDIASETGLPVEYVTTYFVVSMNKRFPLTRVEAS